MPRRFPDHANLEHLKNQAKTLQQAVRSGDPEALTRLRQHHPRLAGLADDAPEIRALKRSDAQLALAREYGFTSWPKLREHVAVVDQYTRRPDLAPVQSDPDGSGQADEFLRLACLRYGGDRPQDRDLARDMLTAHPELASADIHTMAAVGDIAAARELLARDPTAASREGGPHRWEPLLYACYSRLNRDHPGDSTVEVARLLLQHGADPDAGYLWDGMDNSPFTALTGAFGGGEDAINQPPHEQGAELARVLLDSGADPNDPQTLYNRQFEPANDHLKLLFDYGLGAPHRSPWAKRLAPTFPDPAEMLHDQLLFAAHYDFMERVELLVEHGVDVGRRGGGHPSHQGRSAYEIAVLNGNVDIAEYLAARGADRSQVGSVDEFIGACLRGDRTTVDQLLTAEPALLDQALAERSDIVTRAVERGGLDAVQLLVDLGVDVNDPDRSRRITALHAAASDGRLDMVELLLRAGADPNARDRAFDATPSGWADHQGYTDIAQYLERLEG